MIAVALKYLTPYLAKIGIGAAILAAAVAAWLYVSRLQSELHGAQETIAADSAKCANSQMATAAQITAAAQAQIGNQHVNLDAAQAGLQTAATATQAQGAASLATITVQAARTGQDGTIPPVLVQAIAGLRSAP